MSGGMPYRGPIQVDAEVLQTEAGGNIGGTGHATDADIVDRVGGMLP